MKTASQRIEDLAHELEAEEDLIAAGMLLGVAGSLAAGEPWASRMFQAQHAEVLAFLRFVTGEGDGIS